MKVKVKIHVRESCSGVWYSFCLFEGRKLLCNFSGIWRRKSAAIRNAKKMSNRIGIPYSDELMKQHGC
jgi:hypothetical protein